MVATDNEEKIYLKDAQSLGYKHNTLNVGEGNVSDISKSIIFKI
jgi:hypothetical protein